MDRRKAEQLAESRAQALFRECLSDQQWNDYATRGHFDVVGGTTGRTYRITRGTVMNIEPLNGDGTSGPRLCIAPVGTLPMHDVLVAQKYALEAAEEVVLALANYECRVRMTA